MSASRTSQTVTIVTAVIVGLSIGYGSAVLLGAHPTSTATLQPATTSTPSTQLLNLRTTVAGLQQEQADLMLQTMQAAYAGRPDYGAATGQLDHNSQAQEALIQDAYGADVARNYYSELTAAITYLTNYTTATHKADKAAANTAIANLVTISPKLSGLLGGKLSQSDKTALSQAWQAELDAERAAVDAYAAQDFEGVAAQQQQASAQAGKLADLLARAIVAQNPSKY